MEPSKKSELFATSESPVAAAIQEIDSFEKQVAVPLATLKKLDARLKKARQELLKEKPILKLKGLIADLRAMGSLETVIEPQHLLQQLERHLRSFADSSAASLRSEIKRLCDERRIPCKPVSEGLAIGPFALVVDHAKESASLFYAKIPAVQDVPLDPAAIVKIAAESAASLVEPPNIKVVGGQLDEAVRVAMVRQKKPLVRGDWRAELPAVFREMCQIRQGSQEKRGLPYSLPRFVVELKRLVQSDENMNGERRFRLETAVLENTKDGRKSVFIPNDVSVGYGEGSYYQAIVLLGATA